MSGNCRAGACRSASAVRACLRTELELARLPGSDRYAAGNITGLHREFEGANR